MKPRVTVLMPVYNGGKYLVEAIESILSQTFRNFEFLIINDGSVDNSLNIIKSYRDRRIKIVNHKKNKGLIFSLNEGLKLAQGEYVARMDSDDVSLPTRLQEQVEFMENNKKVAVCGTWAEAIDEEGRFKFLMKSPTGLLLKYNFWKPTPLIHSSVIIRKSMVNYFKYNKKAITAEDYDLWLRLNCKYKLANINKFLIKYRIHQNSVSHQKRELQLISSFNSFKSILRISDISFDQYKSLTSVEFKLNILERFGLLRRLSLKINYPLWFALTDTFVYLLKKWFKLWRYYDA